MDSVSAGPFRSRQGISLRLFSVSSARLGGNTGAVGEICHFMLLNSMFGPSAILAHFSFLPSPSSQSPSRAGFPEASVIS